MLSAFVLGVIASVSHLPLSCQLGAITNTQKERERERHAHAHKHTSMHKHSTHTHTHIGMHKHTHAHVHSWHAHHTHTHTCKTYIDALVIVVCCFVLVNIELAMGMM